jgi:hypothetical protein
MRSSSRLENLLPHDIMNPLPNVTEESFGYRKKEQEQLPEENVPKNKIEYMKALVELRKATSKSSYTDRKSKKNKGKSKRRKR